MTDTAAAQTPLDFDCPRCGTAVTEAFYGPCDSCRSELRSTMAIDQQESQTVDYEPKMNVTPNHVATKE